jgi:hypothetical protein
MPVRKSRVFFLQVRAVGQQQPAQLPRRRRAVDAAAEAVPDQQRQVAAVIDVRMRQHDGRQLGRVDRQPRPVAQPQLLESLEQAAVDQECSGGGRGDQILGTRDCSGTA